MNNPNEETVNSGIMASEKLEEKEGKKRETPLSIRADPETKDKFYQIVNESFGDDKDAVKKAMKMIVDAYELSHLAALVPSVAMQTENLNAALDSISSSYIQAVQSMEDYKDNLKKTAEEDVAEANAQRDRMAEELKKAQEAERTAIEERDKAISDRDRAQELAKTKTDLADSLQAQVKQLEKQQSSETEWDSFKQEIRSFVEDAVKPKEKNE